MRRMKHRLVNIPSRHRLEVYRFEKNQLKHLEKKSDGIRKHGRHANSAVVAQVLVLYKESMAYLVNDYISRVLNSYHLFVLF